MIYRCRICADTLTLSSPSDSLTTGVYHHDSTQSYWNPARGQHHVQIDLDAPDGQLTLIERKA